MDSNYIIQRLRSTLYKYPTVEVLRTRLSNVNEWERKKILTELKKEFHKESNMDIQKPLFELLFRLPLAS